MGLISALEAAGYPVSLFLYRLFLAAQLFSIAIMGWKYLLSKSTTYELTTERLRVKSGVLNIVTDELELYRVRDYRCIEPFFLRMFDVSIVVIETADRTHPVFILEGVKGGHEIIVMLRKHVEECRKAKGVREIDLD